MADFWECSLWEFAAAIAGWNRAQGGQSENRITPEQYDEMLVRHGYKTDE